jgi:hypothetical protein
VTEPTSEDPHDKPYRAEAFRSVQYKPLTYRQREGRRLIIVGIVAVLIIVLAVIRELVGT